MFGPQGSMEIYSQYECEDGPGNVGSSDTNPRIVANSDSISYALKHLLIRVSPCEVLISIYGSLFEGDRPEFNPALCENSIQGI